MFNMRDGEGAAGGRGGWTGGVAQGLLSLANALPLQGVIGRREDKSDTGITVRNLVVFYDSKRCVCVCVSVCVRVCACKGVCMCKGGCVCV